jgi:hypothetical protein
MPLGNGRNGKYLDENPHMGPLPCGFLFYYWTLCFLFYSAASGSVYSLAPVQCSFVRGAPLLRFPCHADEVARFHGDHPAIVPSQHGRPGDHSILHFAQLVSLEGSLSLEILPGQGIGVIRFGMTRAEIEEKLGKPLDASVEEDESYSWLVLEYPEGLYLFFDSEEDFRLSSLEVDRRFPCTLFTEQLVDKNREQVLELLNRQLSRHQIVSIEEEEDEDLQYKSIWISSLGVRFYFDLSDELQEVQWGPLFGSDDGIIWPESD